MCNETLKKVILTTISVIFILSLVTWIPYIIANFIYKYFHIHSGGISPCNINNKYGNILLCTIMGIVFELILIPLFTILALIFVGFFICFKSIYISGHQLIHGRDQSIQITEKEAAFGTSETVPLNSSSS